MLCSIFYEGDPLIKYWELNFHFIHKKIQKKEDDLPSNSEGKSYWLVVFLHFLGSQEEDYVTTPPSPSLPLPPDHGILHILFFPPTILFTLVGS